MKKLVFLIALTLLLSGCGHMPAPSPESSQVFPEESTGISTELPTVSLPEETEDLLDQTEESLPLAADAYQVVYNMLLEDNQESAVFQGIGPDGSLSWTYETGIYPMAQLSRISPIGRYQDHYYLIEDGTVVALHIPTGKVLFKNKEFMGSPAEDAMLIDEFGYLYLAGFDGPDFFAMDPQGNTVVRMESISEDFAGPFLIEQEGDRLIIYMESNLKGETGRFPCYVEREWLPQAKG